MKRVTENTLFNKETASNAKEQKTEKEKRPGQGPQKVYAFKLKKFQLTMLNN
ncbi:MAG: hypothetical protein GXY32_08810 [Ruminococcaceae bacterium]|nr:hypothetical protein [Oscillospiraceae bacterium]